MLHWGLFMAEVAVTGWSLDKDDRGTTSDRPRQRQAVPSRPWQASAKEPSQPSFLEHSGSERTNTVNIGCSRFLAGGDVAALQGR